MTIEAVNSYRSAPHRFMQDPEWARRSAGGLAALIKGDAEPTQEELDRIADGLRTCDERGAALAEAIGAKQVTLRQFREVLNGGLAPESPMALREFFAEVERRPDWVDDQLLVRGASVMRRGGRHTSYVMDGGLVSGYRSSADTRLLSMTGGLGAESALRRLGETAKWFTECCREGGMERDGEGWKLTVHVRLMHALINRQWRGRPEWDVEQWGLPISSSDQAATLGLQCTYYLIGIRMLGIPVSRDDAAAVMHLWRYVGWLIGVEDHWLPLSEQHGRRTMYHLSLTAPPTDEYSRELAAAYVLTRGQLHFDRLQHLRRRWATARSASLLRVLVGGAGLRELGLTTPPPWYHAVRVPTNLVTHGLARVVPGGLGWLDRRGQRELDRELRRLFGATPEAVAPHCQPA